MNDTGSAEGTLGNVETTNRRDYLVLDMTSMRFSWSADRTALALLTQRGEIVAVVDTQPSADPREEAYRALDAALDKGRVLRARPDGPASRARFRIAFYNPYTGEVTAGRVPDSLVLGDGALLELPADGAPAVLERADQHAALLVGSRMLTERTPTFAALTRALASHRG
jgi:hypothetical protein